MASRLVGGLNERLVVVCVRDCMRLCVCVCVFVFLITTTLHELMF